MHTSNPGTVNTAVIFFGSVRLFPCLHVSIELSILVSIKSVVLDCTKLVVVGRLVALRALAPALTLTSFMSESS